MKKSTNKFVLGTLVGAVVGCTLVLLIWQFHPFNQFRNESGRDPAFGSFDYLDEAWQRLSNTNGEVPNWDEFMDFLDQEQIERQTQQVIESLDWPQDGHTQMIQDSLVASLSNKSPQAALDLIWQFPWRRWQSLVNIVVATQSIADLEQALDVVLSLPRSYQEDALRTMMASLPDVSESEWKELTDDVNLSKLIVRVFREAEIITQLDQPTVAWDQLLQDDVDNEDQKELLILIANARIESEGYEVLSHLYDSMYPHDQFVLESIMRELLDAEPKEAFQIAKNMPYESRNFVLPILVEAWAKESPKEAYFAVTEIGDYQTQRLYWDTIEEWAKSDPLNVLDSLSEFKRVDRTTAVLIAISELVATNPEAITQRLEELLKIPGVSDDSVEYTLVSEWSQHDPMKAIDWIQEVTVSGSQVQARYLRQALRNLISFDSDKALELALNQPLDSYFVENGYVGDLFEALVNEGFLDTAIGLIDDLPDEAVYSGVLAVGQGLIEVDRWPDAIELANSLGSDRRESYLSSISFSATYQGVQTLIDQLKEMPNNETRRYIANELVREHTRRGDVLTEQQLEIVQSLLPMDDQRPNLNDS
ncbi:MAG: hypothetical protein OXH31_00860 [Gammaproteobacteria bacterium]|nr:hypothetical protein [Gammaproteobacteria bacterium]